MTDSTHALQNRRRGWLRTWAVGGIVAVCLVAGLAPSARADGDPASDVLATQSLFLPQDAAIPAAQQLQLAALVQEAGRSGYPIRVALIASGTDLGSITELWREPVEYAKFLGQELALTYRGTLIVIMPNGFGLYGGNRPLPVPRALSGLPIASTGRGLALTAERAVQRLAAAAGHPLSLPQATAPGAATASDALPWGVFALGLVLIAAAWGASLRARPLGAGHERTPAI